MIAIEVSPCGYFKAQPDQLGLTAEEAGQLERGLLPGYRMELVLFNVRSAMCHLSEVEPMGSG